MRKEFEEFWSLLKSQQPRQCLTLPQRWMTAFCSLINAFAALDTSLFYWFLLDLEVGPFSHHSRVRPGCWDRAG